MSEQQHRVKGRVIDDRFILREPIGEGRMSSVYLASDSASANSEVAIKVLDTSHPDNIKRELFRRETDALKRLRHPGIVGLRHSGWSDSESAFYLVLDYLPYSLDRYLRGELQSQLGNLDPYRVMRELTEALVYAHSENVIHRDIKPSNILFDVNSRPMLTDFGISKLRTHLTVGETLAAYWSSGYASPEQRAGQPVSTSSDVYSLGATFFHLLSSQEPPPDGPTAALVDEHVKGARQLKNVIKRLLATNPTERPSSGTDLLSALEITRRLETLPTYFLMLTRSAIRDIVSAGYSLNDDFQSVADVLIDDFGGMELDEVHVRVEGGREHGDVIILGDSLRLICTPDVRGDALVVKAVQTPYVPNLDVARGLSMPCRAMWLPVEYGFQTSESSAQLRLAASELDSLLGKLRTYETVGAVTQQRRNVRREFIENWDVALRNNRVRIEREAVALEYTSVVGDQDYLRFTLAMPPPDSLDWKDDTPLAVKSSNQARLLPVGTLVSRHGVSIEVATQAQSIDKDDPVVPESGFLTVNVLEALSANTRQEHAVRAFLNDQMVNPRLADAIVDPSIATRISSPELSYFQSWLSDDKKEAVNKAVTSNELFVIQGPPGTGKTSVIAEIVLQILQQDPEARILLTSQSNNAVDHALMQIEKACGRGDESGLEMVRLGRAEKISHGGQSWTLEERARSWRDDVLGRCSTTISDLQKAEREAQAAAKASGIVSQTEVSDAGTLEEWIAEAKDLVDQVDEFEQEYAAFGSDASRGIREAAREMLTDAREQLRDQVRALVDLLPNPIDTTEADDKANLDKIIKAAAAFESAEWSVEDPEAQELQRIQEIRRVVTQWMRVVGLTEDFKHLIGSTAQVVAATCLFSGRLFRSNWKTGVHPSTGAFDWAIVDEAGRATVPEILVPIVRSRRAILVGDERQLPPMVEESVVVAAGGIADSYSLDTSLFQSLVEQMREPDQEQISSLRTQYRMHPAIGTLVSKVFYDGNLKNGIQERTGRRDFEWLPARVLWISTSRVPNRTETRYGDSYANPAEADVIVKFLERVDDECDDDKGRPSVGVIAGYSAQVEHLVTKIDPRNSERWRNVNIEIATVDSFQGRECDVVVYSTVRSNRDQRIGFLRDYRRINVALSRARDVLAIVGDDIMMETAAIGGSANPFAEVVSYIRSHTDDCKIIAAANIHEH